jgi:hypothetical protein
VTVDQWDKIFAVNARGTFLCYKHASQQMIRQGRGGRIIGASSLAGKQAIATSTAYSSTKFAIRGMTQAAGTFHAELVSFALSHLPQRQLVSWARTVSPSMLTLQESSLLNRVSSVPIEMTKERGS